MNSIEFKKKLYEVFDSYSSSDLNFDDKINLIENILIDYQKDNELARDISNKGKKWSDEELNIYPCIKNGSVLHLK